MPTFHLFIIIHDILVICSNVYQIQDGCLTEYHFYHMTRISLLRLDWGCLKTVVRVITSSCPIIGVEGSKPAPKSWKIRVSPCNMV